MRGKIVRFAAYRQYEETRVAASNAMMALLAGAQLASHLLQLMEGSDRLLPEVFPRVPHIGRFNLSSEAAREILNSADLHLGAMSVPYALSLYEEHLKTCLVCSSKRDAADRAPQIGASCTSCTARSSVRPGATSIATA